MTRLFLSPGEKPLFWMGSSQNDLRAFPEDVKDRIGDALGLAQFGETAKTAKPWRGEGPGVFEVVEDGERGTYRAVYTVRFQKAIYVLHAFQKKSPSGIRTARRDVELVGRRLSAATEDYEGRYGKEKK
jgi:phage-related protein